MAIKKEIELEVKVDSVGTLKQQLKEAQREVEALAAKFGATSEQATNAAKKAAELKDQIGDAKALTDAFNPDAKFNAFGSALQGVAGGFSAVQGAMGLIGVESSAVEATLLKVQSAMALSQGINSVMAAKDSFTNLAAVIGKTALGQKLLTAAQVAGAATMRVLNVVMAANPILLVVAGITALVGALAYFTSSSESAAEANDKLNESLKRQEEALDASNSRLIKSGETKLAILEAQGADEKKIHNQTVQNIKNEEKVRQNNIKFIEQKHNEKKLLLKRAYEDEDSELIKATRAEIYQTKAKYDELYSLKQDLNDKIRIENIRFATQQKQEQAEEDKKNAEKASEASRKAAEKRKAAAEAAKAAREKAAEEKRKQDEEDAKNEEAFLLSAKDRNKNFNDTIRQNNIEADNIRKKAASDYVDYIKLQNERELEEERKKEEAKKELRANQIQGTLDTLNALANISELFAGKSKAQQERAFKIQKAVNIATAVIDTYKAANAALASGPPPFSFIAMGAAITAGLVNVKKIASQKFEGGSASSGGGGFSGGGSSPSGMNGSTVITPNFNIVGNNGQNQLGQLGSPIQAYVVSSDMTSQQQLDRNRLRNATF
jgi:DNA repair exonuclease SbcCD ATPase subunit